MEIGTYRHIRRPYYDVTLTGYQNVQDALHTQSSSDFLAEEANFTNWIHAFDSLGSEGSPLRLDPLKEGASYKIGEK